MIDRSLLICGLLAAPLALNAASTEVSTRARLLLRFEMAAHESMVAREGPYSLTVESGRTVLTVTDRTHRRAATVTTRLAGTVGGAPPVGEDLLPGQATYLMGSDPAGWRSGVPLFGRAVQHGVYRGIDLVFHGDTGSLEYDFLVHPGARAGQIALDISGASGLNWNPTARSRFRHLQARFAGRNRTIYQRKDGVRQPVAGAFALHGQRVTFTLGAYDHTRELIIDPTLAYATYLGGNDNDSSRGVAVDSAGNIYVTGFTYSVNLPVTGGSLQTAYHGGGAFTEVGGDAFVAKYTPAGVLAYVTYLGGSNDDAGDAIAVDSAGNVYLTGFTVSNNFPTTTGAIQTTYGGAGTGQYLQPFGDAFVAKLNPTGTKLIYSDLSGRIEGRHRYGHRD